jgi:hypothetical protein
MSPRSSGSRKRITDNLDNSASLDNSMSVRYNTLVSSAPPVTPAKKAGRRTERNPERPADRQYLPGGPERPDPTVATPAEYARQQAVVERELARREIDRLNRFTRHGDLSPAVRELAAAERAALEKQIADLSRETAPRLAPWRPRVRLGREAASARAGRAGLGSGRDPERSPVLESPHAGAGGDGPDPRAGRAQPGAGR